MFDPYLVLELVPLLLSGAVAIGAGVYCWLRGPRTPLLITLSLLLVFMGHLALVGALVVLPNDPGIALRLYPVFQIASCATALAFLVFLFAPHLAPQRIDTLLSTIILSGLSFIGLVLWQPALYWSASGTGGPVMALGGIRAAAFGLAAWLLAAHAFGAKRFPHVSHRTAFLLSLGFAVVALHHAATATLHSLLVGKATPDAGFLAVPFLAGLVIHLLVLRARAPLAKRHLIHRFLIIGLAPALLVVLAVDLLVLQVLPTADSALMLNVVLEHLWTVALAANTLRVVRTRSRRPIRRESPQVPTATAAPQQMSDGWTTTAPRSRSP